MFCHKSMPYIESYNKVNAFEWCASGSRPFKCIMYWDLFTPLQHLFCIDA